MKNINFIPLLCLLLFLSCNSVDTDSTKEPAKADQPSAAEQSKEVIYGLDLSLHQGTEIDWLRTHHTQFSFIICKASEGLGYVDPKFRLNWQTIPELGLIRGAYHFYRTKDSPVRQAEHFARTIQDLKATDIPPIIDFEEASFKSDQKQSVEDIQGEILLFLKTLEEKLGRKPMIYTDNNIGNKYLNRTEFGAYALWIANYAAKTKPLLPKAWDGTKWLFWQKTGHYILDGKKNDFDAFNGSKADLEAFIKSY